MAGSRYIPKDVDRAVRERDGGRCRMCGRKSEYMELDHITPHSKGAPATVENIQLLCRACNIKKRDKADTCPTCLERNPLKPKEAWIPHDAVVCHRCNTPIARTFVDSSTPAKPKRSPLARRLSPIARKLLMALAIGMIVFGLGSIAISFVSNLWGKFSGGSQGKGQTGGAGVSCTISDNNGKANLKRKCDVLDCDNDPSTVAGKVTNGTSIIKTGNSAGSTLSTVGEWTEVTVNGQAYYVASSRLTCP